ncbi:MAG TPA: hypothetical protein VF316_11620 [Polyangiaceae bacterium]
MKLMERGGVLPLMLLVACASNSGATFEPLGDGSTGADSALDDSGSNHGSDSGFVVNDAQAPPPGDGGTAVATTIYANTDDSLYSMDPNTMAVTLIGKVAGLGGGANDTNMTDMAVNANGDVFVNSESVVYKAAVPNGPGTVQLTKVASISLKANQKFYALAFTPAGALEAGETLIGGDGNGELWSIDASNGTTKDLGNFGPDSAHVGSIFALSGDLVFYEDANNKPTGLATIRSCKTGTTTCIRTSDYLAGVDMTALAAAFKSGTPGKLLTGIYGGSKTTAGAGTGYGDLFGLGAWQGNVFAFARKTTTTPPRLVGVSTVTGAGTVLSSSFPFTNGWSGAGVSTKVTVNVPPPPPPPN